jgi:hypothetical protein
MIWTKAFWKGLSERGIKTAAQTLAGLVAVSGLGILDVDWQQALSVTALVTLASVLTSIGTADFVAGEPDGKHSA